MRKFLFLILLSVLACKTADKALSDRNYDKAYKLSMKALKKEKSVKENKTVLEKSLTEIIKREQSEFTALSNSEDLKKWDKALDVNLDLQQKIKKAATYLGNIFGNEYDQLQTDYDALSSELSEAYFTLAIEDLEKAIPNNDKLLAQDAYHFFIKSEDYGNENPLLDSLKTLSLEAGLLVYVVDADGGFDYDWEINRKFDDVESYSNAFRKIVYDRVVSDIDCSIDIRFDRLDVTYDEDSDSRSFQERIIVGTETQVDTSGNETEINVYETVEGIVYTVERVKIVRWDVRVRVQAHTGNCVLQDDSFREVARSSIEEYRLEGDERAIPDRYKGSSFAEEFEDTDDMAEDLLDELYRDIVNALF